MNAKESARLMELLWEFLVQLRDLALHLDKGKPVMAYQTSKVMEAMLHEAQEIILAARSATPPCAG